MKESLLRSLSTFNLLPNLRSILNPYCIITPALSFSSFSLRFFSSKTPDPSESNLTQSGDKDKRDISDEELREQLNKVHEGNEEDFSEAFPTVFRAILSRMLEGKSSEELNKEFSILRGKDDQESDSE